MAPEKHWNSLTSVNEEFYEIRREIAGKIEIKTSEVGVKSGKLRQKAFKLSGDRSFKWIKRCSNIPMRDGCLACFNTSFMTRIYYKQWLQSIVDFYLKPRSMKDTEQFLERMPQNLRNGAYDFIYKAIDRHFLVNANFSEKDKIAEITKQMAGGGVEINILYMVFSLNCNLRCPHCIILKKGDRGGYPVMTKTEIESYVDYFCFNMEKSKVDPEMIFYGGEPLLYPSLIKHSVLYAEKKAKADAIYGRFKFSMVTNGTIVDDEFLMFARDHNISMIVSLDGFAPQHDKFRVDKDGRGSFRRAIAFSDRAREEGLNVTFSVTATPLNLRAMPRFIAWLKKRFEGSGFGINRLYSNLTKHTRLSREYYRQIEQLLFYCATHDIAEGSLMRRWESFDNYVPFPRYCGGVGNQIVFLPGGLAGPCQSFCDTCYEGRRKNFVKIPFGTSLKNHPLWKKWDKARAHNISRCVDQCNIFSLCGGGCAYQAYRQNDSICSCDEGFCHIMKSMLRIYLLCEFNDRRESAPTDFAVL